MRLTLSEITGTSTPLMSSTTSMASNMENNNNGSPMTKRLKARSILKEALVAFYKVLDPSKLPKLDALLGKYWMNEKVFVARIVKKYGKIARAQSQLAALQQGLSLFLNQSESGSTSDLTSSLTLSSGGTTQQQQSPFSSSGTAQQQQSPFSSGGTTQQQQSPFSSSGTAQQQSPFATQQQSLFSTTLSTSSAKDPTVFKNALVALYQIVDPSKLQKLDAVLQRYRTNEKVYVERICKKYGADMRVRRLVFTRLTHRYSLT